MRKYASPQTPYEQFIAHSWQTWREFRPNGGRHQFTPFDRMHEAEILGDAYSPRRKITAGDLGLA